MRISPWVLHPTRLLVPTLGIWLPLNAQVNWRSPESLQSSYRNISSASGQALVVTANPLASDAAIRTLKKGGTAMDAIVTAQAVLTVVEPQSSGLGGGGFLLYWDQKKNHLHALDGRETASVHATQETWLDSNGTPISWKDASKSLSSIGVPGTTALLWEGHKRFGRLSWEKNLTESIRIASDGFFPSPRFINSISLAKQIGVSHSPTFKSLYLPSGLPPSPLVPFQNKDLAATLTRIAKGGAEEFYRGKTAKQLINDLAQQQTKRKSIQTITSEDLANYQVYERQPVCRLYRQWRICSMPPPSGGGIAVLQTLGIYEELTISSSSTRGVSHWHLFAEALRLADADRSHWVGDPIDWSVPVDGLLSDNYLKGRAKKINLKSTTIAPLPGEPKGGELLNLASQPRTAGGGTTHIVVVDAMGNIASYTGSVETVFGSRYISGGMVLNNQLTDFSFIPSIADKSIANRIGPNKRPMSSMAPVIVFHNERPVMALGSPGGWLIPHYVANALIRSLDFNLPPKEVVSKMNLSVDPRQTFLENRAKDAEAPTSSLIHKGLTKLGHKVKAIRFSSGLALIQWKNGVWHGAADPRREGKATALP